MKKVLVSILLVFLTVSVFAANKEMIVAGGCFWCVQADFDKVPGVVKTIVGYDGGYSTNPTYEKVAMGKTHYAEAVKIIYNPDKVSYQQLLSYFWRHIDPTVKDAQFCDHGAQYRSAIFYLNASQKQQALASKESIEKLFPKVYTEVSKSTHFYPAEKYHQDYYKKNPVRYKYYRWNCGRDDRVKEVWRGK